MMVLETQPLKNYYHILGVHRSSTAAEVRTAYLSWAKVFHPDNGEGNDDKFKLVVEAYDMLAIPERREKYNRVLDRELEGCAKCKGVGFISKQRGFTERVHERCGNCGGAGRIFKGDGL